MGIMGAVLTAFYMFRLIFLTFHGEERLDPEVKKHIHESPKSMTIPLVILAFFSVVAGYIGLPVVFGEKLNFFGKFLEPVIKEAHEVHLGTQTEWMLIAIAAVVALLGIFIAYVFYIRSPLIPRKLATKFPNIYKLMFNKYYVDEIYNAVFVNSTIKGSEIIYTIKGSEIIYDNFDLKVIDGAVNGTAKATGFTGKVLSYFQSGLIKDYALIFLLGVIIFLAYLLF
jgi:NADH-quinone oxidoreductase subunit L